MSARASSFDMANCTSAGVPRGPGMAAGLKTRTGVSLGIAGEGLETDLETDRGPNRAPLDGPRMILLDDTAPLIADHAAFGALAKARPFRPIR